VNIKLVEPDLKSATLHFFVYYNFTRSEQFTIQFTDLIKIPIEAKTGYTSDVYGDFEIVQQEFYTYTNVNNTDFTYDAYAHFKEYLDLEKTLEFRNRQTGKLFFFLILMGSEIEVQLPDSDEEDQCQ
jgi:hypothetical protein